MNRISRAIALIIVVFGCITAVLVQTQDSALTAPTPALESGRGAGDIAQTVNFGRHFQELGVSGAIAIYDLKGDRLYEHNPQRNRTAFLPASTFKILNSLISLETGVISNELAVLTWDGIERQIPAWNRDLNMKEAIKISAVWFYQVLARRVGYEQMQKWVTKVGYANQKIGNKDDIDKFWLSGELRIAPNEQIEFLRRLYKNELPFSERSLSVVKDIIIVEQTPDYTIRAKTGWAGLGEPTAPQIGWYVGYIEQNKNVYFFATNIDIRSKNDPAARIELTRRCLKDLALL